MGVKFNIRLDDVDVAVSQKPTDFTNVAWSDLVIAVGSCQSFGKSNKGFQSSDGHLITHSGIFCLLSLSDGFVFIFEDFSAVLCKLWIDCSAELNVCLELLFAEIRGDCMIQ